MKMYKKSIILLFGLLSFVYGKSQHSLESNIGWMFFDLIGKHEGRHHNFFFAYNYETEFIYKFPLSRLPKNMNLGVGYMFTGELDGYNVSEYSHHLNAFIHYKFQRENSKSYFDLSLNNYLLLNPKADDYQRRLFVNAKIGYNIKLGKNLELLFKTPITIIAPYYAKVGWRYNHEWYRITARAEMIGLSIGLNYNFTKN